MKFPFLQQSNAKDCGPTCLRMIVQYYGKNYKTETIRNLSRYKGDAVSIFSLSDAAKTLGFDAESFRCSFDQIRSLPLPSILHWNENHYVVLVSIDSKGEKISIADPAKGMVILKKNEFIRLWYSSSGLNNQNGIALLLQPTKLFYDKKDEKPTSVNCRLFFSYIKENRRRVFILFIAMIISSGLQLAFPYLTKKIVDVGIPNQNLHFISLVLIAQISLTFARTFIEFIRSWVQLKLGNSLVYSLLSNFFRKLTRVPFSHFDAYPTGDTMQRLGDCRQIQVFLTGPTLSIIFSIITLLIFSVILITYSIKLFIIFCLGSAIYFFWIKLLLPRLRYLNYQSFYLSSKANNATLQFVQGMQDIRLNNAEILKTSEWQNIQIAMFSLNERNLKYGQLQQAGGIIINQVKDLVISFMVAKMVVSEELTLGTMIAIQFIIAQLSNPVQQLIGYIQSTQNAKISLERLNEIHQLEDEESIEKFLPLSSEKNTILVKNLKFSYTESADWVLQDINVEIPEKKITAIVGVSGSGKTTLLKLLLKFYDKYEGEIQIGENNLRELNPSLWRSKCGVVLQDGYIFNDTIARNIALGDDVINYEKLEYSCKIANIYSFIQELPNNVHTLLGAQGIKMSRGQSQRLFIARAIYRDPQFLFLDEATNALDSTNETEILDNLHEIFSEKTVVMVAHRFSTVKYADNILVLKDGKIIEGGPLQYLIDLKGFFYKQFKSQFNY